MYPGFNLRVRWKDDPERLLPVKEVYYSQVSSAGGTGTAGHAGPRGRSTSVGEEAEAERRGRPGALIVVLVGRNE